MTAICASHYRNPLNDHVGKKHHHKNRFRQRQSSRSAFYQPGLRVMESRHEKEMSREPPQEAPQSQATTSTCSNSIPEGHWGFRPSALQYEDYARGDMSVSEIVDCYVRDNERAEREGVAIPPRPTLQRRSHHRQVRDALFSAASLNSTSTSNSTSNTSNTSSTNNTASTTSLLRCLQWNIQAFLSPKDERNMHTITAGIIRSICETDSDVLILNEIHWRELEHHKIPQHHNQAIRSSQALLEEVLRLRGYHFARVANHGDTPTMVATRKRVLKSKEVILSDNRSALCLLLETNTSGSKCWVVGTHLDAFDAQQRRCEISRLLQEDHGANGTIPMVIAGDFNQQRSKDYTPAEWNKVARSADLRGVPLDDGVATILEQAGFTCSLDTVRNNNDATKSNSTPAVKCNWNPSQPPPSTHWSGTTIDYTYFSNHAAQKEASAMNAATSSSTTTTIAPHGVYVGPAGFSDHRMTVTDWTLTTQNGSNNSNNNNNNTQTAPPRHIDKTFFFHHLPAGRHHSWLYSYKHRHNHYRRSSNRRCHPGSHNHHK